MTTEMMERERDEPSRSEFGYIIAAQSIVLAVASAAAVMRAMRFCAEIAGEAGEHALNLLGGLSGQISSDNQIGWEDPLLTRDTYQPVRSLR